MKFYRKLRVFITVSDLYLSFVIRSLLPRVASETPTQPQNSSSPILATLAIVAGGAHPVEDGGREKRSTAVLHWRRWGAG
jgi:hypothetical protein